MFNVTKMKQTYLPSFRQRMKELWSAYRYVRAPPKHEWYSGDVLIVLDAIEAYRSLYTKDIIDCLLMVIKDARDNQVPIVFTRWCRTTKTKNDAIDRKGHWSEYVPAEQTELLKELTLIDRDTIADVFFTNALTHSVVMDLVKQSSRIVLAGGWTESCVIQTARASCEMSNLAPTAILSDVMVGHALVHTMSLMQLQMYCANVVKAC